ncbi:GFA family protein [Ideonella sp. A 288]|uniref:GFA family protein n=1 Tax=Ideonella sp. A 288 TaxID=1962181 RepID=UPI00130341D3|nr:GFA family protein [Ideonella sp. A 288]
MTPLDGRCACGALAFRLSRPPLFVHACHCTRCQRETGGAFAHHLMIETAHLHLLQGEPHFARVPTDSGRRHWVVGCAGCQAVVWNAHGSRNPLIVYLRVGTLDAPATWPPRAHIFVRSKPAWMLLDPAVPQFSGAYDARRVWPAESVARHDLAQAARAAGRRAPASTAPVPAPRKRSAPTRTT